MKKISLTIHQVIFNLIFLNILLCSEKDLPVIPKPEKIEYGKGTFTLTTSTKIFISKESESLAEIAKYLSEGIHDITKISLSINYTGPKVAHKNAIVLRFKPEDSLLIPEGYRLKIYSTGIFIEAPQETGIFYGVQSLLQLCVAEKSNKIKIPSVVIQDKPRFKWRGMHLDVSRHFFTKDFIKKYIDILALHKMNVFHWHLTDDQGWRLEIKRYPKLTEVGAWRVDREDRLWNDRPPQLPDEKATYGGFYTQDDIREVVEYARKRYVTIVPEIEMPAHATAALVAYPQYSCTGGPFTVPPGGVWPISDIYCAGNDSTFVFLENILDEVISLFPGEYIHIGGDEADKSRWMKCEKCQKRIRENNLKDESELQSYFIKRISLFLNSRGKKLIGWDEILEGGLAENATVMSWRGIDGGIAAARERHDVVMTPGSHCYFDFYQGKRELEPLAIGGFTPLSKVYSYKPIPDVLTAEEKKHILGAQANVWTEYITSPEHVEYMIMPRIAAMSEVVWSPAELRDWKNFVPRVEHLMKLYQLKKYNYAKSAYIVSIATSMDSIKKEALVSLQTEMGTHTIRYTIDGGEPTDVSPRYERPFRVKTSGVIKAATFIGNKKISPSSEQRIFIHKAFYCPVALTYPYRKYSGGGEFALTNGICGSLSYDDGNWQGFEFDDLEAIIDLGNVQNISKIGASFLQNTNSWIFLPKVVEFSISTDGLNYKRVGYYEIPVATGHQEVGITEIKAKLNEIKTRYIKLFAKNVGLCPDWHIGKGGKTWIFIDEITVE